MIRKISISFFLGIKANTNLLSSSYYSCVMLFSPNLFVPSILILALRVGEKNWEVILNLRIDISSWVLLPTDIS